MRTLILIFIPLFVQTQDVTIGSWKDYQSYKSASYVSKGDGRIYCVTSGALFYINKDDYSINRLSKVSGLSDVGIKHVKHSHALNVTVITYENCNIDIIKNNSVINISDIKRKEIAGGKEINNISIINNIAYLSCTFGLVVLDLEREEVKDTYSIISSEASCDINNASFTTNYIYLSTSCGGFYADINSPFLSNFNSWSSVFSEENVSNICFSENFDSTLFLVDSLDELSTKSITLMSQIDTNTYLCPDIISVSFNNNQLQQVYSDKIIVCNGLNLLGSDTIYHPKITAAKSSLTDSEKNIWIADSVNGLLRFKEGLYAESFIPQGPVRNDVYSLEFQENKLYMSHGGHENFGSNALINDGVSIKNNYDEWINNDREKLGNCRDILAVAVKNGTEYYASWYHGIAEITNGSLTNNYGFLNTNGALDTTYYSNNRIRISDLKFDSDGNLWALSSEVNHPLVVKTKTNNWYSFSMNQNQVGLFFDDLIIDSHGQKWGVIARGGGLFVFNNNNTLGDPSDDEYKILNTSVGGGNLPSLQTYSIAEDLNGEVWVGTDKGIAVFYNPQNIFSGYNFDAQQIIITDGDYGQYLLSEERVKCINIDGANRKWIGTEKSGVFLLSEDGKSEVLHFTKDNSPLLSNNIIDIAINHDNGEVFIGTEKGVVSYRSDATLGAFSQAKTHVFPNPVEPTYSGPIAIKGLVSNANVKITDISGSLVFETTANGGQAVWNGKNKNGERASTGVYLVLSTDLYGEEKIVSKILFIH